MLRAVLWCAQPQDRVAGHSKAHSTGPLGSIGQPLTGSFSAVRLPASIGSAGLLSIQPMLCLSALVTCERAIGHAQGLGDDVLAQGGERDSAATGLGNDADAHRLES